MSTDLNFPVDELEGGLLNMVMARELGIVWDQSNKWFVHPGVPARFSQAIPDFQADWSFYGGLMDAHGISLNQNKARIPAMKFRASMDSQLGDRGDADNFAPEEVTQYGPTSGVAVLRAMVAAKHGACVPIPLAVWQDAQAAVEPQAVERERG